MHWSKYIFLRVIPVLLPVVMALASARAQDTVYVGQASTLSVIEIAGDIYSWELYNDVTGINLASTPGNCPASDAFFTGGINTGSLVNVTWLSPGTYFFKVTASRGGCTMHLKIGKITVVESLPTAQIEQPPPICTGDTTSLNINLTGVAPWSIDITDGTNTQTYDSITENPFVIDVSPTTTTSYTITRVSDANSVNMQPSNTVTLIVKHRPVTTPIIQYGP